MFHVLFFAAPKKSHALFEVGTTDTDCSIENLNGFLFLTLCPKCGKYWRKYVLTMYLFVSAL